MYETPPIIAELGKLLRQPLQIDTEQLETQIIELEVQRYDLALASVDMIQLLAEKRKQMLWPKDAEKNLTELDRTVRLEGDVAVIERDVEFLKRIELLVEQRLSLSIVILRNRQSLEN